jgi:hypothetical protein
VDGIAWPAFYEIRIAGRLDRRWAMWFEGLQISSRGSETVLSGDVRDQSALRGVLDKLCDFGVTVVAIRRLYRLEGEEE